MAKNILIAEDNPVSMKLIENVFRAVPGEFRVTLARDGREAWSLLNDSRRTFDLCITDLVMPHMDGFQVIEAARESLGLKNLPFIVCTSNNDMPSILRARSLGVRHYILKPFKREDVLKKARQTCASIVVLTTEPEWATADGDFASEMVAGLESFAAKVGSLEGFSVDVGLIIEADGLIGASLMTGHQRMGERIREIKSMMTAPSLDIDAIKDAGRSIMSAVIALQGDARAPVAMVA